MPTTCCVPNCKTWYKSQKKFQKENVQLFSTTNLDLLSKWSKAIPRKDYVFTKYSRVCINHFVESDILRGHTQYIDGKPNFTPYKKLRLKSDAIPSVFPNCPAYLSKSGKKRKPPTLRCDVSTNILKKPRMDNALTSLNSEVQSCDVEDDSSDICSGSTCTNPKICEENECTIPKAQDNTHSTNWGIALEKISLPQFWSYQQIGEELFTLFQTKVVNDTIKIVKGITLKQNSVTFCVNGESCTPKDFPNLVSTVLELEDCIKKFDEAQICIGIFIKDNFKLVQTPCK